jgi:hypothetical protein
MNAHYIPERFKSGIKVDYIISDGDQLVDQPFQDPHETSLVKVFDIGTRLELGERVYRYGFFNTGTTDIYAVVDKNTDAADGFYEATNLVAGAVGDRTVVIRDVAARVVDHYKGGWVNLFHSVAAQSATNHDQWRRITSSTVNAGGGGTTITLGLDYPLTSVCVTGVAATPSNFSKMGKPTNTGAEVFVGFPCRDHQASTYGWVQTWGPCMGHYNLAYPGSIGPPGDRDVYLTGFGEIITPKQSGADAYKSYQRAGYILTTGGGTTFFMLQLGA